MKKIGVLFGGRSQEHEISVLSASAIIMALVQAGFEPVPIGITKTGDWCLVKTDMIGINKLSDERFEDLFQSAQLIKPSDLNDVCDFVFPALHGPYGEDGTVQGLFEIINIPYAGCNVACSAIAMDKIFTKEILIRAGIPVCMHESTNAFDYQSDPESELSRIEEALGYPVYIKPANMGSSVGVSRADTRDALKAAITDALQYDSRIIIEEEIFGRELETAILGNDNLVCGAIGEIVTDVDFYDYDTKYRGGEVELVIPADISDDLAEEMKRIARKTFKVLSGTGFARVDFFFDEKEGRILVNEMNTIPGFTIYSMFPLLWNAVGIDFKDLVTRIIELGYERYNAKNNR